MNKKSTKFILISLLILFNFFIWREILFSSGKKGLLTLTFLDIGQGDAILIDDGYGNQILIDGGNGEKIIEKLEKHLPLFDRNIEVVLLTHPDFDHLGGILKVLEFYEVDNFLYSGLKKDTGAYYELCDLLEREGLEMTITKQGMSIIFGNEAQLTVLYPEESLEGLEATHVNEYSVTTKLSFGDFEALLPGDGGRQLEAWLLRSGLNLEADLLKAGHHGSNYSSHPLFISRVNPKISVISVGENNYGHPHPDVLERLKNTLLLRTDKNGDVQIITDGKKVKPSIEFY